MKAEIVARQYNEGGLVEAVDCYKFDDFESAIMFFNIMFPYSQEKMDYYVSHFDKWELVSLEILDKFNFKITFLNGLEKRFVHYSLIGVGE